MYRTIASLQNDLVKHLVRLRQNNDYRLNCKTVIIEGIKPVRELCQTITPKCVIAVDEHLVPPGIHPESVVIVPEDILHKISGMLTPEGLIAEFPMPHFDSLHGMKRIIALDNVRDPGNLGSLFRTALALGWEGAFLIGENCDPYNEKALRAARGATFRLPHIHGSWEQLQNLIRLNKMNPLIADLGGVPLTAIDREEPILLLLSNEAHGASPEGKKVCQQVTIPLLGEMESLNVAAAGAILMYQLK